MSSKRNQLARHPALPDPSAPAWRIQPGSPNDPEMYLSAHPPGPTTDFLRVLGALLRLHNDEHALRPKFISLKTKGDRHRFLVGFFRELRRETPYRKLDPRQLAGRHVQHMVKRWQERGLTVATVHCYLSMLRTFAGWIGKHGMVREPEFYVGKDSELAHRSQTAVLDKSWTAKCVDIHAKIAEVSAFDPWVGLQLELCAEFGLRGKEARHFRPHEAVIPRIDANERDAAAFPEAVLFIRVYHGTKGGRPRDVPLATEAQHALVERLRCLVAPGQFVGNPEHTATHARHRFYYVIRMFGISKKELGVVAHGLRHQVVNDAYALDAGGPSPVRLALECAKRDEEARRRAARLLGHGRLQVTNCYLGSSAGLPKPIDRAANSDSCEDEPIEEDTSR
jgi:integrase